MARRQQSVFEDLMAIAAMLPWQVALALAVASYFGFHHLASLPSTLIGARNPLQSLGDGLVRQFLITFSMILQYLRPLAFVLGAFMSAQKRRRQAELHAQVASAPNRHFQSPRSQEDRATKVRYQGTTDIGQRPFEVAHATN